MISRRDERREVLGRLVRQAWVAWAREQLNPKPSWLTAWDELDAGQREVDMRIGEALFEVGRRSVTTTTSAVNADHRGLVFDGDLLRDVIANACPEVLSAEACDQTAERALTTLAGVEGVTVLRGPDSEPWTPTDPDGHWCDEAERGELLCQEAESRAETLRKESDRFRRAYLTEQHATERVLAEALGYHRDAVDDPHSPCPGEYVTGDHTALTLAMEAAGAITQLRADLDDMTAGVREEIRHQRALREMSRATRSVLNRMIDGATDRRARQ